MKNTLAENMMRFGVKNLSESDIKKIEESTLNEQRDIDLLPKYGKIFQQELLKGIKAQKPQIVFFAGPYYVWTKEPNPITYDTAGDKSPVTANILGKFIDLYVETVPGIGQVPMIPSWDAGFGGMFEYKTGAMGGQVTQLMYSQASPALSNIKSENDAIGHIQTNFGKFSPQVIQQLYNISQYKPQIDQAIATLKTKPNIIAKLPANMKTGLNIV